MADHRKNGNFVESRAIIGEGQHLDPNVLENARKGLTSIYRLKNGSPPQEKSAAHKDSTDQSIQQQQQTLSESWKQENDKEQRNYLVVKKPVEKSIFYQHSKQGMKYWYEEKKPVSYQSKIALGRKGTLLGLVDSPYK